MPQLRPDGDRQSLTTKAGGGRHCRVDDPRLINLIRRWLKAGVLEDGAVHPSEQGTPQGESISVLLSNVYLHYVLDLWFERVVKGRLRGEARLARYIDDFVICFQYRSDAVRVQDSLRLRLGKFGLSRQEPPGDHLLPGSDALLHAKPKRQLQVGMRTEKSRLRRSLTSLQELMREIRHHAISVRSAKLTPSCAAIMPTTASLEIFGASPRCSAPWSVTGIGCCAAAVGPDEPSIGACSTRSKNGRRY